MKHLRLILPLLVILVLPNCAVRYVAVSAVPRSDLRIVVFTDNRQQGLELLDWLEERGYDNPHNQVALLEEDEAAIYWGAAPLCYVEEIAAYVEGRFDNELERERDFRADDYSVFVHLDGTSAAAQPDREDLRVVVFTDDPGRGDELLAQLRALGYTNDESYVTAEPNDDFNIKWGAATDEMVEEVVALVDSMFGVVLDRQHTFAPDDNDLFVNLPFRSSPPGLTRADFVITVFADSATGGRLLRKLAELGYSNDANEVLSEPNDEPNVKYGALPEAMLEEIARLVEEESGASPELLQEFGRSSPQVFINIPAPR